MSASTKLKITYQVDENKTSSKTLRNRNPEATNPPRVTKCLRRGTGLSLFFIPYFACSSVASDTALVCAALLD